MMGVTELEMRWPTKHNQSKFNVVKMIIIITLFILIRPLPRTTIKTNTFRDRVWDGHRQSYIPGTCPLTN